KLAYPPSVKDLTGLGFDLVGGRLDYMYKNQVAAIIYRRGEHVINLFAWPATGANDSSTQALSDEGFSIFLWSRSGTSFCALPDFDERAVLELAGAYGAGTS